MKGKLDQIAGLKLAEMIRQKDSDMPIVLQSTNIDLRSAQRVLIPRSYIKILQA